MTERQGELFDMSGEMGPDLDVERRKEQRRIEAMSDTARKNHERAELRDALARLGKAVEARETKKRSAREAAMREEGLIDDERKPPKGSLL